MSLKASGSAGPICVYAMERVMEALNEVNTTCAFFEESRRGCMHENEGRNVNIWYIRSELRGSRERVDMAMTALVRRWRPCTNTCECSQSDRGTCRLSHLLDAQTSQS
jgi:hypothetical protein